ncbi:hypothetical protein [Paenibacillus abyssi]|uniref:Uncharacterized protein n=1 Tax=Paenibacillus abyssi TaxID=1340531 RepID=A0A917CWU5_9BACL|nr:hypothetical protein [Paenibacillus abyssi]GGG00477.1 hypothetical protein GCM10010916_17080 [Paenibacillus abyssi]
MQRNRTLMWALVGIAVFMLTLILIKSIGHFWSWHSYNVPGGHWRGERDPHGFPHAHYGTGFFFLSVIVPLLLKLALIAAAVLMWFKGSGFLKWGSAILGVLALMSLLTPLWAVIIILLLLLLQRRMNKNNSFPAAHTVGTPPHQMPMYNRGKFLDEWERNQQKEEK